MQINKSLELKIEKKSQPEWALLIVLFITMFNGFFVNVFHFPSAIKYIIDAVIIFLLCLGVVNLHDKKVFVSNEAKPLIVWIVAFFAVTLIVYIFNFQSMLYYLWGLRNNFRFYVFFFVLLLFFKKKNVDSFFKFLEGFFWANAIVCLIQYFVFGLKGDLLGGFFGAEKGCNGYLNIFLVVIAIKSVIFYLNKKEGLWLFIAKCSCSLLIATLSEIKFFFIEFIAILVIGILITGFSFRKLALVIVSAIAVMSFVGLLGVIFPHYEGFMSLDYFVESATSGGYASKEQLNRLTTIPTISEEILTTAPSKIFGLGLGNCETSTFDFLKTPFYYDYVYLRYHWFTTSFLFLETGFLGLIFFFGFFVSVIVLCFLMMKKNKENMFYSQMAIIAAALCIIIGIYNASMRSEASFLLYFMLAVPFITQKRDVLNE